MYSDIHSFNIYESEYIRILIFSQKWLLLVKNCLIWAQNNTQYENGQNSPKQSWANNHIFEYIGIFCKTIFICKNIR